MKQFPFLTYCIMGDFNFPSIDWTQLNCTSGDNSVASLFLDAVQDSFLTHVTNCTRHWQGQQSSLLDLVFSSDPNLIDEVTNLPALGNSDHDCLLLWNFKCYDVPPPPRMTTPMFIYRRGDYRVMNDYFTGMNCA